MTAAKDLSPKALAIFCFALYHQLTSGEEVSGVIAEDGAGHKADPEGVDELVKLDLATVDDGFITFTASGATLLKQIGENVRNS